MPISSPPRLPYFFAATCLLLALPGCQNDAVPPMGHIGQQSDSMDTCGALACDDGHPDSNANPEPDTDTGSDTEPDSAPNPYLITPRFDPQGEGFFRTPWPSNHRVFADGTVDLRDFPDADKGLIARTRAIVEHHITGFSTAPVVYTQIDRNPGASSLIEPKYTQDPSAPIQLVDVSPEGCGQRVPLLLQYDAQGDEMVAPGMLEASVVEGFTLDPETPYAFVMLKTFGRQSGFDTTRPDAFDAVIHDVPTNPITASLAPLWACAETAGLDPDDIAIASVFTTQNPTEELERITAFVRDPERLASPPLVGQNPHAFDPERTIEGRFQAPIFMRGQSPYVSGGGFEFDAHGSPVVQRWEEVPFLFARPKGEGPFPVVLWLDGTCQEEWDFLNHALTQELLNRGVAVLSFTPQFHGSRATQGSDPSSSTFNLLNPESLRTVLRQQASEASYAVRLLRETLAGEDILEGVDTSRIMYAGHSQGALVGAMVAGVDPNFRAYLLSGGASHLSTTIVSRDEGELEAAVRSLIGVHRELDRFHPAIQLAQLAGDVVDPHNYAHQWGGTPSRPEGANVLMLEGLHDHTTAPEGMGFFVIAGDAAPLDPAGWDIDPFGVWDREPEPSPIQGNRESFSGASHTVAALLDAKQGHFTLYNNPAAHEASLGFLTSAATGVPEVAYTQN